MAGPMLFPRIGGHVSRKLSTLTCPRMTTRKLKSFVRPSTDFNLPIKLRSSQLRYSHSVSPAKKSEPSEGKVHEQSLLKELIEAVSAQKAPFFCGGEVRISDHKDNPVGHSNHSPQANGKFISDPIVIRWDSPREKTTGRLTLPLAEVDDGVTAIEGLLRDCAPATFGIGGEEVLDESYRKAVKLDAHQFSTNFNPYDVGIVDAISQILLPGIAKPFADGKPAFGDNSGVVAELYTLNIYSGPSGKFQTHVDTPRGADQFGSLVISLPYPHVGGELRVAHKGQETIIDWGQKEADKIQWAAFYSDCEHEVLEVKKGHRITLTYNLYVRERVGGIIRHKQSVSSDVGGLGEKVKRLLKDPAFMIKGGMLGFYCQHAYAHTNRDLSNRLPYALKGVDAHIYSIFHHMGLEVKIRPVMEELPVEDFPDEEYNIYEEDEVKVAPEKPEAPHSMFDETLKDRQKDTPLLKQAEGGGRLVGSDFHAIILDTDGYEPFALAENVEQCWKSESRKDIVWFNEPGPKEVAMVHLPYGNTPTFDWHYSSAAVLVEVPACGSESREKALRGSER